MIVKLLNCQCPPGMSPGPVLSRTPTRVIFKLSGDFAFTEPLKGFSITYGSSQIAKDVKWEIIGSGNASGTTVGGN